MRARRTLIHHVYKTLKCDQLSRDVDQRARLVNARTVKESVGGGMRNDLPSRRNTSMTADAPSSHRQLTIS